MQEIKGRQLERGPDRVIGGVCSGLAHYFSIDPLLVRLVFVLLALASGAGVALYAVLWLFVPEAGEPPRHGDVLGAGIRSVDADLRRIFGNAATTGSPPPAGPARPVHHDGGLALGILLIVAGAVVLGATAGLMAWWSWTVMWPVLVIGLGLLMLVRGLS